MRLLGVDFTSAPSVKKPITAVWASLRGGMLQPEAFLALPDWAAFESLLQTPGPWLAAFDFPLSLPVDFLSSVGWPVAWPQAMAHVSSLSKADFEGAILAFMAGRPYGDKYAYRQTDRATRSSSALKLGYPPVGKMHFQGAPRLWRSGVSVVPCAPCDEGRIAVEAYPALVARRFAASYKAEEVARWTPERQQARAALLDALVDPNAMGDYGFRVGFTDSYPRGFWAEERGGDRVDALLCAVQAGWAAVQGEPSWGVPPCEHASEGWIVDPAVPACLRCGASASRVAAPRNVS